VPSSAIESDGRVLKCRRCMESFRVFPPLGDESLAKDWLENGQTPGSTDPVSEVWTLEAPNTRIDPIRADCLRDFAASPSEAREANDTDEDFIDARDGITDRANTFESKQEQVVDALKLQAIDESLALVEPYSIHDDPSEASLILPFESSGPLMPGEDLVATQFDPASISGKGTNSEPLDSGPTATDLLTLRTQFLTRWRRFPVALRAAIVVFPFVFIVGLIFGGGDQVTPVADATPTNFADADRDESALAAAKNKTAIVIRPEPELTQVRSPREKIDTIIVVGTPGDESAPEGHAFVQAKRLRIRSRPSKTGKLIGRVKRGDLIRVYDQVDAWSLVFVEETGAAGFVKTKFLGQMRSRKKSR
jgi:hypothetical protein